MHILGLGIFLMAWISPVPAETSDTCALAAKLSGGEVIRAGDAEAAVLRELGPPDRIVSGSASDPGNVREHFVYYLQDGQRHETITFEVVGGRVMQICEIRERRQ